MYSPSASTFIYDASSLPIILVVEDVTIDLPMNETQNENLGLICSEDAINLQQPTNELYKIMPLPQQIIDKKSPSN